jgi:copper(I)-binding protein
METVMSLKKIVLTTALLAISLLGNAHEYRIGDLHIDHPWSREMPPVAPNAAAYLVVRNEGSEDDRLLSVETPVTPRAEIHEHVHANGAMKMQAVKNVLIPAGGEVKFAPMGYHIMLFNVQQAKAGEHFPLTLIFAKAGRLQVDVKVQKDELPESAAQHEHAQHP